MTAPTGPILVSVPAQAARTLPHSLDAEMSVVGGILLHPKSFAQVADAVKSDDFYHPAHGAIFEAMVELDEAQRPIDAIAVADRMRANDSLHKLRAYGGESYFAELTSAVVTIENIRWQAQQVAIQARVRRVIETSQEITAKGFGNYGDAEDFLDGAEKSLFAAAQGGAPTTYEASTKILNRTIKAIEQRYDKKQAITGVPSGFHKLDAKTAGWQPCDLIIIAGRPSMGKTSLVMNAVQTAAIEFGVPALVFSLEMDKESLMEGMLCREARIDSVRLRSGFLEQRDWIALTKAATRISEAKISIDDTGAPTILDIRARARRWRAENPGPHGVIVVDYLQLIDDQQQKWENSARAIGRVSRGLKLLAKELRVPVIALSQLNRAVEDRANKRPMMSDLRESGAIEQDADVIAFIYRDEVYHDGKDCKSGCARCADKGVAEVIIGKQRKGPIGTVRLKFLNEYTRFENLLEDRDD